MRGDKKWGVADETYLEGVSLVTGNRINYNRVLQCDAETRLLLVDESLRKADKFAYILHHGTPLQKWSVFESLHYYLLPDYVLEGLTLIRNHYDEYAQLLPILAEGLAKLIAQLRHIKFPLKHQLSTTNNNPNSNTPNNNPYGNTLNSNTPNSNTPNGNTLTTPITPSPNITRDYTPHQFSKLIFSAQQQQKIQQLIFNLIYRSLTLPLCQTSPAIDDWVSTLRQYLSLAPNPSSLMELTTYIGSSFKMNSLPQRRKTAFSIMLALLQSPHKDQLRKDAYSKALFFNSDHNPATRLIVCTLIGILLHYDQNDELWKCIHEYYTFDKHPSVKDQALRIMASIYHPSNCPFIHGQLNSTPYPPFVALLPTAITTYSQYITTEKVQLLSFLNRLLKSNNSQYVVQVCTLYPLLCNMIEQHILLPTLTLDELNLEDSTIMAAAIFLLSNIKDLTLQAHFKKTILSALSQAQYYLPPSTLLHLFSVLKDQNDLISDDAYILVDMVLRAYEQCKWRYLQQLLLMIPKLQLKQSEHQKLSMMMIRLFNNCPYFLLPLMSSTITHLLLIDRKSNELLSLLREKAAKTWVQRRNYILLYFHIKTNTSLEFSRGIPTMTYASVLFETISAVKMEFIRVVARQYHLIEPSLEKNLIADTVVKLQGDRDPVVRACAAKYTLRDREEVEERNGRNRMLLSREAQMVQVVPENRKACKTEKSIKKRINSHQVRNSLKIKREDLQIGRKSEKKYKVQESKLIRCNSTQNKNIKSILPPKSQK